MNFRDTIGHSVDAAATGAVSAAKSIMAYVKQLVTNSLDWVDGGRLDLLLDALQTGLDGGTAAVNRAVGKKQSIPKTFDLNQAANTYDLFTATAQAVILEDLVFALPNVNVSDDATITSISIQSDHATPQVLLSSVDGAKAYMTAEQQFFWEGKIYLAVGDKIQITIAGGAADVATVCNVVAGCRSAVNGGYLA
ncbi:MAG: hypothetical protein PHQ43_13685 [Dehalococcoidales bacterium]|nr:hypothetical protein [Dehalococcoidales bacterium]